MTYIRSLSLMVAVQLDIPEAIHSHGLPISLPVLASSVGVPKSKVPALGRLMRRSLAHFGVFRTGARCGVGGEEAEEEVFYCPTILSKQLVKDNPTTAAPFVLLMGYPLTMSPWYSMADWFRLKGPDTTTSFQAARGETLWESLGRVPEFNDVINNAMACDARWAVGLVAREHPKVFRGLESMVDVGGGNGAAAKAIKEVFPEMNCSVLELPHVVAASPAVEGVDFVAGDMFAHVPPADGIFLKWVLHNWDDDHCVSILRRCREAITSARQHGGKVIIMETIVGGDTDDHEVVEAQLLLDLDMLANTTGREREEEEWRRILAAAGFSGCKITPALGPQSLIEAYP